MNFTINWGTTIIWLVLLSIDAVAFYWIGRTSKKNKKTLNLENIQKFLNELTPTELDQIAHMVLRQQENRATPGSVEQRLYTGMDMFQLAVLNVRPDEEEGDGQKVDLTNLLTLFNNELNRAFSYVQSTYLFLYGGMTNAQRKKSPEWAQQSRRAAVVNTTQAPAQQNGWITDGNTAQVPIPVQQFQRGLSTQQFQQPGQQNPQGFGGHHVQHPTSYGVDGTSPYGTRTQKTVWIGNPRHP